MSFPIWAEGESRAPSSLYLWGLWISNPRHVIILSLGLSVMVPFVIYLQDSSSGQMSCKKRYCGSWLLSLFQEMEQRFDCEKKGFDCMTYFLTRIKCRRKSPTIPIHRKNCAQKSINTLLKLWDGSQTIIEEKSAGFTRDLQQEQPTIQKAVFPTPCIWVCLHQKCIFLAGWPKLSAEISLYNPVGHRNFFTHVLSHHPCSQPMSLYSTKFVWKICCTNVKFISIKNICTLYS